MIIVVNSCWAYRDAWKPFFALLGKFWPEHPRAYLLTDIPGEVDCPAPGNSILSLDGHRGLESWGPRLARFAVLHSEQPILLMQEDFFLTTPIKTDLVQRALEFMRTRSAAALRLYPCPGADQECGDPNFGLVSRGSAYRVSCQATIWRPGILNLLGSMFGEPAAFELQGTEYAATNIDSEIYATKRESQPWPIEYICSAISRGRWNPDAKRLCDEHGIEADWSMRQFAA